VLEVLDLRVKLRHHLPQVRVLPPDLVVRPRDRRRPRRVIDLSPTFDLVVQPAGEHPRGNGDRREEVLDLRAGRIRDIRIEHERAEDAQQLQRGEDVIELQIRHY
jgi:hypothetical protein